MIRPTTHTFCKDKKGRRCTVAIRQDKEIPNYYNVAVAVTAKEDNFSRNIGKKIVYGRLDYADNKGFLPSGVICNYSIEACKYFLLNNFELTEKRIDMMLNKDLAVHHHHRDSLIATTAPSHSIAECELTTVGNRGNDLDVD